MTGARRQHCRTSIVTVMSTGNGNDNTANRAQHTEETLRRLRQGLREQRTEGRMAKVGDGSEQSMWHTL